VRLELACWPKPAGRPNSGARIGRPELTWNWLKNELDLAQESAFVKCPAEYRQPSSQRQNIGSAPDGLNPNAPYSINYC